VATKKEWKGKETQEIIGKLRKSEIVLAHGRTVADACRRIGVTERSFYRWCKEYGGLKMDQARRMKDLAKENQRLRRGALSVRVTTLRCAPLSRVRPATD
jgi:transposase-like protein